MYLATAADIEAGNALLAGFPIAYRTLQAALRAGCDAVALSPVFRDTAAGRAVDADPRVRAATVWPDDDDAVADAEWFLLLPAALILPEKDLRALLAAGPGATLSSGPAQAPVALLEGPLPQAIGDLIASGKPAGPLVRALVSERQTSGVRGSWCVSATTPGARREAERRLYADAGSAIDSRLDRAIHRPLSRPLARLAVALGLSPNALSLLSVAVGLGAVWSWAGATVSGALMGLALYYLSVVLDHADGAVARITFAESRLGEWLDVTGDSVVHMLGALALGLAAERAADWGFGAGIAAMLGFGLSALVAKTSPLKRRGEKVGQTLTAIGTRDGYYLLLLLALACVMFLPAALPYLVLLAAIASHAYWLANLVVSRRRSDPGHAGR